MITFFLSFLFNIILRSIEREGFISQKQNIDYLISLIRHFRLTVLFYDQTNSSILNSLSKCKKIPAELIKPSSIQRYQICYRSLKPKLHFLLNTNKNIQMKSDMLFRQLHFNCLKVLGKIVYYKRNPKRQMEREKPNNEQNIVNRVKKDSQQIRKVQITENDSSLPTIMQNKHVYEVYDKIASHFSHTRYKPWPKIQKFLKQQINDGQIVLDIGCGNGKYMGVNPNLYMIGTDRSMGLIKTAAQKNESYQLFGADSLYLPVRSGVFDAFISIAVIHHFSNQNIRHRAIDEMVRVLRVGGVGLIYVWAFQQDFQGNEGVGKKKFVQQDVFVPWHLHFKYEKDLENIDTEGCQIDMQKKSVIYKRYYHVFKQGQLQNLLKSHDDLQITQSYYDKQNWCCKVKKLK